MNGRDRVRNALARLPLDRVPVYDAPWEDTLANWREQGMPADTSPEDYFDWDIAIMGLDASMRQDQEVLEQDEQFIVFRDRCGYTVRKMVGKSRAMEFLSHATVSRERWDELKPGFAFDPDDTARVDVASYFMHMEPYPTWGEARVRFDKVRSRGRYLLFGVYGPWEGTWRHRGMTELLMDVAAEPDWAREMAETQVRLTMDVLEHAAGLGMKPDGFFLVEDLAGTRSPLISPESWRSVFKPSLRELGDLLRRLGVTFWIHSCGNIEPLLDDLIECGVEVVQPLQAHAGLDVRELKPRYGDRLAFWGNIDARKMSGPLDALDAELREKITFAKQGGGYLYHSDHSVPCEVTFERYCWIMDRVAEYGAY